VILATAVIATVGIPLLRWKSRKQQLRHVSETQRVSTRKKGSLQDPNLSIEIRVQSDYRKSRGTGRVLVDFVLLGIIKKADQQGL
jgi:hypothetical protein